MTQHSHENLFDLIVKNNQAELIEIQSVKQFAELRKTDQDIFMLVTEEDTMI